MSIGLLRSCGADIVNGGVTGRILCGGCGGRGGGGGCCNAAISGVRRPRIAPRSLEGCEVVGVSGSAGDAVM